MKFFAYPIFLFIQFQSGVDKDTQYEAIEATYNARDHVERLLSDFNDPLEQLVFLCVKNTERDFFKMQDNNIGELVFLHSFAPLGGLFRHPKTIDAFGVAWRKDGEKDIYVNLDTTFYPLGKFKNIVNMIAHEMLHLFGFEHSTPKHPSGKGVIGHIMLPSGLMFKDIYNPKSDPWAEVYNFLLPQDLENWTKEFNKTKNTERFKKDQSWYYHHEQDCL